MSRDWNRLATAIREARKRHGWGQSELAKEAGIGYSTVQRLESGSGYTTMPLTIDRVERALGWAPRSAEAIVAGGDPVLLVEAAPGEVPATGTGEITVYPAADFIARLPVRIQHELTDSELVDTEVIELNRPGMRLVTFVVRDRSDEEEGAGRAAEDIKEWTRIQRRLRDIDTEA
ncbi:helix-turn-helix transcriptional regulator [Streptomyces phaeochromogenes]|uniref:helix-turn-helix domain-containing protein n=1 Tax=Streptomyces phaeochromogenes TaxID=1923 RepID=UPI0022501C96|nr:helix-turn-helix transcriptional regulator [Streptomyces phaeochromogenes]MCX5601556.1 helix-turn-helix transcriptional regulator [Streptomyces phaeochromogenes]